MWMLLVLFFKFNATNFQKRCFCISLSTIAVSEATNLSSLHFVHLLLPAVEHELAVLCVHAAFKLMGVSLRKGWDSSKRNLKWTPKKCGFKCCARLFAITYIPFVYVFHKFHLMDKTYSPHPEKVCVVVGVGVNLHRVSGAYCFFNTV